MVAGKERIWGFVHLQLVITKAETDLEFRNWYCSFELPHITMSALFACYDLLRLLLPSLTAEVNRHERSNFDFEPFFLAESQTRNVLPLHTPSKRFHRAACILTKFRDLCDIVLLSISECSYSYFNAAWRGC